MQGLYPTIIILIVHLGLSQLESVPSSQNTMAHTALHFASHPTSRGESSAVTRYSGVEERDVEFRTVNEESVVISGAGRKENKVPVDS